MNKSNLIFIGQSLSIEEFKKRFNTETVHIIKNPKTNKVFFKAGSIKGVVSKNIDFKKDKTNLVFSLVKVENEDREFWLLHKKSKSDFGKVKLVTEKPTYSVKNNVATQNKIKKLNVQDKTKFITDILDYSVKKRADDKTKERLINLIGKEIEKTGACEAEVIKRLEKIENTIFKDKSNNTIKNPSLTEHKGYKTNQKLHNPKKILEWLQLFTINITAIKYSTHLWDQEELFSGYDGFIKQINDEFEKYKFKEMAGYNSNLYWNKIYPFVFQKQLTSIQKEGKQEFGWGKHKIKIGWQYPDTLKQWCKNNPVKSPLTMELPEEIKPKKRINSKTIKYFEDVINIFKKEIEFRDNDLFIQIKTAKNEIIPKHDFVDEKKIEALKGVSFYTNTEYVIKAIYRIFNMIKQRTTSTSVGINCSLNSENNEYIIEITHQDSFSNRPINDSKILINNGTGDLHILKTTLMSLCEFSIESRFKNEQGKFKYYRIEYLYDGVEKNNWQPRINKIDEVEGFKFILKFPTI